MPEYCPNCGEAVQQDAAFCDNCGAELRGDRSGSASQQSRQGGDEPGGGWTGGNAREASRDSSVPRKNAVDTLSQGFSWLFGEPVLIGVFVAGAVVSGILQIAAPGLRFVGSLVNLLVGAVAFVAAERKLNQRPFDVSEAFNEAVGQIVPLIVIVIGYGIVVGIGLLLLIVPGIYLGARLSLALPACVLDKKGIGESFSTSWDVAGGNLGKIIGIFLLFAGIVFAVGIVSGGAAVAGGVSGQPDPALILVTSAIGAVVAGGYNLAIGRVYLENRHQREQPR